MPWLLKALAVVGTAAMLWVGGSIIVHSLHQMGWHWPEEAIGALGTALGGGGDAAAWAVKAVVDGGLGLAWGLGLVPVGTRLVAPAWAAVFGDKTGAH
jgi:predicted DNA repair protein MutK